MLTLQPFQYRTYSGGEMSCILVWGRLQDIRPQPTSWVDPRKPAPLKMPFVIDERIGWADPNRLTLLDGGGCQPPAAWVEYYQRAVGV